MRNGEEYVQKYKDYMLQKTGTELAGTPVPNSAEVDNYNSGTETDWTKSPRPASPRTTTSASAAVRTI